MQKVREGMVDDADESEFTTEHALNKEYLWTDKYRPRKPRYFNRVHTVSSNSSLPSLYGWK